MKHYLITWWTFFSECWCNGLLKCVPFTYQTIFFGDRYTLIKAFFFFFMALNFMNDPCKRIQIVIFHIKVKRCWKLPSDLLHASWCMHACISFCMRDTYSTTQYLHDYREVQELPEHGLPGPGAKSIIFKNHFSGAKWIIYNDLHAFMIVPKCK